MLLKIGKFIVFVGFILLALVIVTVVLSPEDPDPVPVPAITPSISWTVPAADPPEPTITVTDDPTEGSEEVRFANCAQARKANAAPIHRGDPGYSRKLDRNGDGTACE